MRNVGADGGQWKRVIGCRIRVKKTRSPLLSTSLELIRMGPGEIKGATPDL